MPPPPKHESSSSDRLRLRSMVFNDDDMALCGVCYSINRLEYSLSGKSAGEVGR